jgi:Uma2 family endonuclease
MATIQAHRVIFDPQLTDEEYDELCRAFSSMQIEIRGGEIFMNPPTGGETGDANSEIAAQLRNWWKTHRRGRCFDSSTEFIFPDAASPASRDRMCPDAAYVTEERLGQLPKGALKGYPPVCPNFVIELRSPSDSLKEAQEKMERWAKNGAALGWLIDPKDRRCYIYNAFGLIGEVSSASSLTGINPVQGFVLDLEEVWSCYE